MAITMPGDLVPNVSSFVCDSLVTSVTQQLKNMLYACEQMFIWIYVCLKADSEEK